MTFDILCEAHVPATRPTRATRGRGAMYVLRGACICSCMLPSCLCYIVTRNLPNDYTLHQHLYTQRTLNQLHSDVTLTL